MKKETRSILKMRAVSMASRPEIKRDPGNEMEIIAFRLADETYGIESAFIREVYPLKELTTLPGVPSYILGIVNVRGQILPVVDLKKFFNLPGKGLGELNKLIIIYDELMGFGILADEIDGTKVICNDELLSSPGEVKGIGEQYIKGITKERLILLSAGKMLTDERIIVNEEVTL